MKTKAKKSESKISSEKISLLKKSALAAILVIFVLALTSGVASATTRVVNQTAPACTPGNLYYATIQAAINAASPGDTIIVCPEGGTPYQETVDVNKSDINISAYNATKPVVSANGASDHVFNITNQENVTLEGFTIRDAHGTSQDVAGIYMYNASECNISDNTVTNISATGDYNALGIWLNNSSNNNSFDTSTVYNLSADDIARGIYLRDSSNNSFSTSTSVSHIDTNADAYGIYLGFYSNNNTFSSSTTVSYINATSDEASAYGIYLYYYLNNNTFSSSTTVSYINATATASGEDAEAGAYAYGIYLLNNANNNSFSSSTTVSYINATATASGKDAYAEAYACGIYLWSANNNSFSSTTNVSYINATATATGDDAYAGARGIYLFYSSDNSFSSGSISEINAPTWWDFYSAANSHRNSAENITISSYPTTISFTYDNGVGIKSVETPPPDHALKSNIGKYVNATNVTANSWLFLNVSYNASDVSGVQEDSLRLWKNNGTWHEVAGVNGVNTAEKYVYANITDFSVFAPLGNSTRVTIPTTTGTGNVTIETDKGYFCNETDALPESPPDPPALTFPHGFFNVTICGLNDTTAENVTINFTFPTAIPTNAEFWKYNSSNGTWYPYPFGDNDGDNVISITITDNGAGDHNPALGVINDPNGVGLPAAAKVPALTPIGMIALVGLLSVIAAMSISIRRKK